MRVLALATLTMAACNGASAARYRHTTPPPLPAAEAALDPDDVTVMFAPFTWQNTAGHEQHFRVLLSSVGGGGSRTGGARIGDVRSPDRPLDEAAHRELYCVWGPGQHDDCVGDEDSSRRDVLAVVAGVREEAARAGADQVRAVRCFVSARRGEHFLWCEGTAFLGGDGPWPSARLDPGIVPRPAAAPSRWKVRATASAGRYGDRMVIGTTAALSYRSIETAFHMVSPPDQRSAGIGLDLLYRHDLRGGLSALGGVTAMLLTPLSGGGEADPAKARGAIGPVLGIGWQAQEVSLFDGFGQPFAELRLGWLAARKTRDGDDLSGLGLELLVGLATP